VRGAYKVVVVLDVAADGHFASAVSTRDIPLAPVEGVDAPWGEVVAVCGCLVLLADKGVAVAVALLVERRVCAGPDVGQAEGGA
jgi:hypothetical protein